MSEPSPVFDEAFRKQLSQLMQWRRDVRRFRTDPVPQPLIDQLLDLAQLSPSVGNSQPWRFIRVETPARRQAIRDNFLRCNAEALAEVKGERARIYARLKLAGIDAAPLQLAVFCDHSTTQGHGLGVRTMPEMLDYSVAGMISCLWLAARAAGLGLGWVSILDPVEVATTCEAPAGFKLIAYLCLGWPEEEHVDPELVRFGWQDRTCAGRAVRSV
jgi:5,6-dimethylbenzimidazole synthase